ncbi:hypothetical protein LINPERHAP1_LOCUS21767, partial [Linum perenne]
APSPVATRRVTRSSRPPPAKPNCDSAPNSQFCSSRVYKWRWRLGARAVATTTTDDEGLGPGGSLVAAAVKSSAPKIENSRFRKCMEAFLEYRNKRAREYLAKKGWPPETDPEPSRE